MGRLIGHKYFEKFTFEKERKAVEFLLDHLPPNGRLEGWPGYGRHGEEYVCIPNIELNDTNGNVKEYDCILVAPHGVYTVEFKDWQGMISGDDEDWYLNNHVYRRNPHKLLAYKNKVLLSKVEKEIPGINRKVWFQPVVVLTHPDVYVEIQGFDAFKTFTLGMELIDFLVSPEKMLCRQKYSSGAISSLQEDIVKAITRTSRPSEKQPLCIKDYAIEEILFENEDLAEYLGRYKSLGREAPIKRLRAFNLPYMDSEKQREARLNKIKRENAALELARSHPNIVVAKLYEDYAPNKILEIVDWSEEGTLRNYMDRETLTFNQKIEIIKGIILGLEAIHTQKIIHTNLRPENIMMDRNTPRIMNLDNAKIARPGISTLSPNRDIEKENEYRAPEISIIPETEPFFSEDSDLYSLGVIFYELICEIIPYKTPEEFEEDGGKLNPQQYPSNKKPGTPEWVDQVINKLYVTDQEARYGSARELFEDIKKLELGTPSIAESKDEENIPPSSTYGNRFLQPGENIGLLYIVENLDSGSFAQTYLVNHKLTEKEYVLKLYYESIHLNSLIDEFNILNDLSHKNIVKVNWCDKYRDRYYITMEYLKGTNLKEYSAIGKLRLPVHETIQVAREMLAALKYLHDDEKKEGILSGKIICHRDIKPNNIMKVDGRGYVLIDFNIAKEIGNTNNTLVGTAPYLAPDLMKRTSVKWDTSGDLFALGVTLYELFIKRHPYKNRTPGLSIPPHDPSILIEAEHLSDSLHRFLLKAVQPHKEDRFLSAAEMEAALEAIGNDYYKIPDTRQPEEIQFQLEKDEEKQTDYNPFVRKLRRLYSQARYSNAGTRGLDIIGEKTYVETLLDNKLTPAVEHGLYKLIIITGNAGDGKTSWIQKLEKKIGNVKALEGKNGSSFVINGIPFLTNYDGSQDEGKKKNDSVLTEFFKPFIAKKEFQEIQEGRIIAINEGRLMEFLSQKEQLENYGFLFSILEKYFNSHGEVELPSYMAVINLNWRSITAEIKDSGSIFENQLNKFLEPSLWKKCSSCSQKSRCFIFYNVSCLSDNLSGAEIRERLRGILDALHMRRQLHITMRDLRSILSYLICRDYGCKDIPQLLQGISNYQERLNYASLSYWNIADPQIKSRDRVITLIQEMDIGKKSNPTRDRELYFLSPENIGFLSFVDPHNFQTDILSVARKELDNMLPVEMTPDFRKDLQYFQRLLRRKAYFEGNRPSDKKRIPYYYLEGFKKVLNNEDVNDYRDKIIKAISMNEGCRHPELLKDYLCIATSNKKEPRYKSFRLYPMKNFSIEVPILGKTASYIEYSPNRFILKYISAAGTNINATLEINLDLFELLNFIHNGFSPSLNDLYGSYIELVIFKNLLEHEPYRSLVITDTSMQDYYRISASEDNTLEIRREKYAH